MDMSLPLTHGSTPLHAFNDPGPAGTRVNARSLTVEPFGPWHDATIDYGSVNFTEFFVTATISATFLGTIGLELWPIIAGLNLVGALAAPIAAYAA